MNFFSKAMVAVTGHYVGAHTNPQDIGGLSKIGLSICFASALAALQFGVAGWFLASGMVADSRLVVAIVMALIGACVVLIIDRNFIYAADTSPNQGGQLAYLYLAIRIFLILVISSLSSQFTLPLMLKSELEIHVQDLRDERYDQAKERYDNKYDVSEKVRDERDLSQKITKIKTSLFNLPQELVHQKLASEQCMREYRKKVNASIGPDIDDEEVANLYAREKMQCEQLDLAYREAYKLYMTPRQAELTLSQSAHKQLEADLGQAKGAFKGDLQKADQNNSQYLNASSADVVWSLIRHNPGARMKYLMITLVQLVLELMPLLLKSLLGRSPLGVQVALRMQKMHETLEVSGHNHVLGKIERKTRFNALLHQSKEAQLTSKIALQHLENKLTDARAQSRPHGFDFGFGRNYRYSSSNANSGNLSVNDNENGHKGDISGRNTRDEHKANGAHPMDGLRAVS